MNKCEVAQCMLYARMATRYASFSGGMARLLVATSAREGFNESDMSTAGTFRKPDKINLCLIYGRLLDFEVVEAHAREDASRATVEREVALEA